LCVWPDGCLINRPKDSPPQVATAQYLTIFLTLAELSQSQPPKMARLLMNMLKISCFCLKNYVIFRDQRLFIFR
jgi:hypothetical protein